ncbi:MAG: hypothetical protein ACO1TE_15490 [Prosthecobacter sp.]
MSLPIKSNAQAQGAASKGQGAERQTSRSKTKTSGQTAAAGSQQKGKKTTADRQYSEPLPVWEDSLIRSDTSLLPAATYAESNFEGYYPTQSDLAVLGDRDYSRMGSASEYGPDTLAQTSMGLFPYGSGEQDFYARNQRSFRGVNRFLGMFTPNQTVSYEADNFPGMAFSVDNSMGLGSIFTRTFVPSKAHLKAGPLALDVLWIGAGALWSDYKGPNNFPENSEDGWIGYIEVALRGYLRLTDSFYLSWAANLMYLPGSNELAFQTLNGAFPSLGFDFFYQKRVKKWDLFIGDEFFGRPGLDIIADVEMRGQDQAGRYMFGYYGRSNGTGIYNSQNVYFVNRITAQATRMMGNTDWRFWSTFQHADFWQTFSFDEHSVRDTIELAMAYEGNAIPFAPRISYLGNTLDGWSSFIHQIQLELVGRITENVTLQTMVGYLWTSGYDPSRDTVVWSANLSHRFSRNGTHAIQVGQQLFTDNYSPETILATYARYYVGYQVLRRLHASAFAQYSKGDRLAGAEANSARGIDNYLIGASAELQLFDFTRLYATTAFERADADTPGARTDRWIHRLYISQQLASRLTLQCGYQYEQFSGTPGFSEHVVNIGIRRYF